MTDEIVSLFRITLPYIVREDKVVKSILEAPNNKTFEERDDKNKLIGVSVVNNNTILLLCVDKNHRNQGIGSNLLKQSEDYISSHNYDKINVGVGFDYLMPGVPVSKKIINQEITNENIYKEVDDSAYNFFKKRGYFHSWKDANCFDMQLDLKDFNQSCPSIGTTIDNIKYCWASSEDLPSIIQCTDDAEKSFSKFYKNDKLYSGGGQKRVLIAKDNDEVVGCLIVSHGSKENNIANAGCTAVKHSHRKRRIASNLVLLATKYLKDEGAKKSFIGYTYTGLDKLYGYAGYQVCVYYFMAKKKIK